MERPAAPLPPKPCRPILDEDPLFPRYKIRGVLAAGARRPLRFGHEDGAARPCLPGPVRTRRGFLGCRDLLFAGEEPRRWRAQTPRLAVQVRGLAGRESRIPKAVAAGVPPPSARREMLLMRWGPPISSRSGRQGPQPPGGLAAPEPHGSHSDPSTSGSSASRVVKAGGWCLIRGNYVRHHRWVNLSGKFWGVTFSFLSFTYNLLMLLKRRPEILKISPHRYTKVPQFLTGSTKAQNSSFLLYLFFIKKIKSQQRK